MSTSATGKRPGHSKLETVPFYVAGCYAIPIRLLYGTAAEINFWDVVYFYAQDAGGELETSTQNWPSGRGFRGIRLAACAVRQSNEVS